MSYKPSTNAHILNERYRVENDNAKTPKKVLQTLFYRERLG
jgi:hypothetical protein